MVQAMEAGVSYPTFHTNKLRNLNKGCLSLVFFVSDLTKTLLFGLIKVLKNYNLDQRKLN